MLAQANSVITRVSSAKCRVGSGQKILHEKRLQAGVSQACRLSAGQTCLCSSGLVIVPPDSAIRCRAFLHDELVLGRAASVRRLW